MWWFGTCRQTTCSSSCWRTGSLWRITRTVLWRGKFLLHVSLYILLSSDAKKYSYHHIKLFHILVSYKHNHTDLGVHLLFVNNEVRCPDDWFTLPRSRGAFSVPTGLGVAADVWDVWAPPVAVAVGTPCPQPFHQGSEGYVQCPHAAPLPGTGRSVVRGCRHRGAQVGWLITLTTNPQSFHGRDLIKQ